MSTFKITQLKAETFLGTYAFEQKVKQTIIIDLEYKLNVNRAAQTNSLHDTLDYSFIASQLTHFVESQSFVLIESMGAQIIEFLKKNQLKNIKLKITKIGCLPNAKEVSLEIEDVL